MESIDRTVGVKTVYDLVNLTPSHNFFANRILVSNCDWGSAVYTKMRKFAMERLKGELQWFSRHKIDLLYNADSNWGIYDRDIELTEEMVRLKRETGFVKKFRAAYAKNSGDRVFQIAKLLNDEGMSKGVTLSFQSLNQGTLELVKRKNIDMSNFQGLMKRSGEANIPTYSELIIGLPGESYSTFADGIDTLFNAGAHQSIQCYTCEVLPNSEMNDPTYRTRHGIKSVKSPVPFFHGTPSTGETPETQEWYEIVTETRSLGAEGWMKCQLFSWLTQAFHCLGATQIVSRFLKKFCNVSYRRFYEALLSHMRVNPQSFLGGLYVEAGGFYEGVRGGTIPTLQDSQFGEIAWPPEEWSFLRAVSHQGDFFGELIPWAVKEFGFGSGRMANQVFTYQSKLLRVPFAQGAPEYLYLSEDIPSYLKDDDSLLQRGEFSYHINSSRSFSTVDEYAREAVWFGRKSGGPLSLIKTQGVEL